MLDPALAMEPIPMERATAQGWSTLLRYGVHPALRADYLSACERAFRLARASWPPWEWVFLTVNAGAGSGSGFKATHYRESDAAIRKANEAPGAAVVIGPVRVRDIT